MDENIFKALDLSSKLDSICGKDQKGFFIDSRLNKNKNYIQLYSLYDFYVEVYYDSELKSVQRIEPILREKAIELYTGLSLLLCQKPNIESYMITQTINYPILLQLNLN